MVYEGGRAEETAEEMREGEKSGEEEEGVGGVGLAFVDDHIVGDGYGLA